MTKQTEWLEAVVYGEDGEIVDTIQGKTPKIIFGLCQIMFGHCIGSEKEEGRTTWIFAKCKGKEICNATMFQIIIKEMK
jgi:hypothetical protein